MSRSYKKRPILSIACYKRKSLKKWKRQRAKCVRRKLNESIENFPMQVVKKLIDPWDAPDDGKSYQPNERKAWRK